METFKIGICEPKDFSRNAVDKLSASCKVDFFDGSDLKGFILDKNAIFIRLKYFISDELVKACKNLEYVCSPTTGLNHIGLTNDKIKIISLKGEYDFLNSIRATPEHIFGLSLALLRNYSHAFLNGNNRLWERDVYKGYELFQNSVGIIGLGRVGSLLATYYSAFGARVGYYDIKERKLKNVVRYESLDELIVSSKIIILSVNYTKENEKMITDAEFALMKNKYFINAARGELVDEKALIERIRYNWFKGVAIDVLSNESQETFCSEEFVKLTEGRNLIVTPHIGGATYTSMKKTEEFIADKLLYSIKK